MTNVMHNFLIYLLIYFCHKCFGLSFNPSSEEGGLKESPREREAWFSFPGYGDSDCARMELFHPGPGAGTIPGDLNHAEVVHLPLKMG
jgi:hypothetical protein